MYSVVRQNFAAVKFLPLDVLLSSILRTESGQWDDPELTYLETTLPRELRDVALISTDAER
jgi:hypothetical protein